MQTYNNAQAGSSLPLKDLGKDGLAGAVAYVCMFRTATRIVYSVCVKTSPTTLVALNKVHDSTKCRFRNNFWDLRRVESVGTSSSCPK